MAHNEKMTNRVREALAHLPDVEEKKMFRGIAFMVNGKMCVSTGDERLMCRIDPAIHDEAVKKKGCETMIMKGREYKGYVYVQEDVIKTKKEMEYWIGLALDFNGRAKASKKTSTGSTAKTAKKQSK
jgi:TfoX/Sxy family transcriptional regulator of competence genes